MATPASDTNNSATQSLQQSRNRSISLGFVETEPVSGWEIDIHLNQNSPSIPATLWSSMFNPAIFIPISKFSDTPILDHQALTSEKLERLIKNLKIQHETVKANMLVVSNQRAKELRAAAQAELDDLGDMKEPPPDPAKQELRRKQMEQIVKNLKARIPEGVSPADLQVKPPLPGTRSTPRSNEDIVTGGTEQRTPAFVRAEIVLKLERLVDDTVEEIAKYEESAKQHIAIYQAKLDTARREENYPGYGNPLAINTSTGRPGFRRRSVSFAEAHSPSANSPGIGPFGQPAKSILRSTANSPIDHDAIRRMNVDLSEADADRYYVNGGFNAGRLSMDAERKRAEVLKRQNLETAEERRWREARELEELSKNAKSKRMGR